ECIGVLLSESDERHARGERGVPLKFNSVVGSHPRPLARRRGFVPPLLEASGCARVPSEHGIATVDDKITRLHFSQGAVPIFAVRCAGWAPQTGPELPPRAAMFVIAFGCLQPDTLCWLFGQHRLVYVFLGDDLKSVPAEYGDAA